MVRAGFSSNFHDLLLNTRATHRRSPHAVHGIHVPSFFPRRDVLVCTSILNDSKSFTSHAAAM